MRINVIGGGPGGLFFAILAKNDNPDAKIVVHERNRRGDTFGFGVVFSDETLSNIADHDPPSITAIEAEFRYWSAMDTYLGDTKMTSDGHGFAALSRVRLLEILTDRAIELGIDVRFESEVTLDSVVGDDVDLVVAADGVNSAVRAELADHFDPTTVMGTTKFIWTGTTAPFDRFNFLFAETPHGVAQAHVYPFDAEVSTFIIELHERTWQAAGLAGRDDGLALGESDTHALAWGESVFGKWLGDHGLIGNNSRWRAFPRIACSRWWVQPGPSPIVLIGDAAHTAHYSIGSGTKLALEDAIDLAQALRTTTTMTEGLEEYDRIRRPPVESLQRAAATSEEWFQQVDHHVQRPFEQFVFSLFTRSQRVTHDNLRERDPAYLKATLDWFAGAQPAAHRPAGSETPPMFYPFSLRGMTLPNRVGMSPMAQYCATDGVADDWHLVHLGSRAVGGAGLVMTEMTCTSADARITPGCPGIWTDEQSTAWKLVCDFVHANSESKIGIQLGHSGRKGSTKVAWEEMDAPLDADNWPLISASAIPYRHDSATPAQATTADLDRVVADFVAAAERSVTAGFDLVEIHAAHGYLLSSFLSPITNRRDDEFGGDLAGRAKFPLMVVEAVRQVLPDDMPLSVRISATDWIAGGFGIDDAVGFGHMLKAAGVDVIDVSTGQVDPAEQPAFGRLYQTPFSEVIRNTVDIPTISVGAISSIDDVNTVLLAGRADLCLLARAHLVDPYWTLNAAIDLGQADQPWPKQYWAGRTSRRREQVATAMIDRDLR